MNELQHAGIKGMRWGHRRFQNKDGTLTEAGKKRYNDSGDYKSTSLKAALARRANAKVDKSFQNWDENVKKRDAAIELGKKATAARLAYEANKGDKGLKAAYKDANSQYKKALSANTAYRKGVVRSEVGKDASRKYLSEAKKIKKQLDADPSNKELRKQYTNLMNKHDIERASARRAVDVGQKRSNKKASIKRTMTMTAKAVATTAAVGVGVYAVNRYLLKHNVTIKGKRIGVSANDVSRFSDLIRKGKDLLGYLY